MKKYVDTGKVKFVWHDFPWIGPESRTAAQATRCAGRQGKFWELHDHLYKSQRGYNAGQFSPANLRTFAGELGIEAGAFGSCLDQAPDTEAIQKDVATAREQGINATPTFVINGQEQVSGSLDSLSAVIDAELKKKGL